MAGFRAWVENAVADMLGRHVLTTADRVVVDATLEALREGAQGRVLRAVVEATGGEKRYHTDAEFRHAVDLLCGVAAKAALGEYKHKASIDEAAKALDPWPGDDYAGTSMAEAAEHLYSSSGLKLYGTVAMGKQAGKSKPVTWDDVQQAAEQLKATPPPLGGHSVPPRRKEALGELRRMAEQRARKLKAKKLVAEAGAKYEELSGKKLTPEEAEKMIVEALEKEGQ